MANGHIRPLFGERVDFSQAFPSVESLKIDVVETNHQPGWESRRSFTHGTVVPTIPCSNPRCKRGGLAVESALQLMAQSRKTHDQWDYRCDGDEGGSPGGRRKGMPCTHSFRVAITLTYRA